MREVLSCKVDDIVNHFVMTRNDETPVIAVNPEKHGKGLISTITFFLEVRGVNIVTCTQKSRNYVASSTLTVTVVTRTFIPENMCLACRKR